MLYSGNNISILHKKQIDNLSKYCYDISKLVTGLAVIGNFISDKLSLKTLWIGLLCTLIFLIFGHLLDRLEVPTKMTNIEIAFTTLAVLGVIGIIFTLLYERKLRKLQKK